MNKELLEIKQSVVNLHNKILDLSEGLWAINTQLDNILLLEQGKEIYDEVEPIIEVTSTTPETAQVDQPVRTKRGRPAGHIRTPDSIKQARPAPEPQEEEEQESEPEPKPEPMPPPKVIEPPKKAPEPAPDTKKSSLVEKLLGKDADQKAKLRAERMEQLKKELEELKGGSK